MKIFTRAASASNRGGLSKKIHGVSIGPFSKILAVNGAESFFTWPQISNLSSNELCIPLNGGYLKFSV